jgi:hypothetical protein
MQRAALVWAGIAVLFAIGCADRDADLERGFDLMAPAALEGHAVFIDRQRARAHVFPVSDPGASRSARVLALPRRPVQHAPRNRHPDELLVLCAGQVDDGRSKPAPAALAVLKAGSVDRVYPFASRFNAMTQSPDGRRVFLSFDPRAPQSVEGLLFNPNEVAIIDLDALPTANNPTLRTLSSFGGVPQDVVFSAPMNVAGEQRELVIVLFDSDIAVWDLNHIERPEYVIELSRRTTGNIALAQVLFGSQEANIYLRGSASDDIFVVSLSASAGGTENDFVPSINQLAAGIGPADMVLYEEPGGGELSAGRRLFVVAQGNAQASVIDNASSRVTSVSLPAAPNQILRFDAGKLEEPEPEQRALLYAQGTDAVVFVDLEGLEDRRGRNVELLRLRSPYSRVLKLSEELVLRIHQGQGLSLLDLVQRTVQPIQSTQDLATAIHAQDKLWLAPPGQDRLGFLDLRTFHPSEIRLDALVAQAIAVPSAERPRFVVTHPSSIGHFTVLDARAPDDLAAAYAVRGFLVEGLIAGGSR